MKLLKKRNKKEEKRKITRKKEWKRKNIESINGISPNKKKKNRKRGTNKK